MNWQPLSGWSPLAVFSQRFEAGFLAERLHDAGIEAEVFGDDSTGLGQQQSAGVAVYVHDADLERARRLVAEEGA